MRVRRATEADEAILRELWEEFEREVPEPEGFEHETWDGAWANTRADIEGGAVYVAEDDEGAVGVVRATGPEKGRSHVVLVHVRPRARRQGVATALLREAVREMKEKGATIVSLEVLWDNDTARTVWKRLGFREHGLFMTSPLDALEQRLTEVGQGESRATIHVQTDDRDAQRRLSRELSERLGGVVVALALEQGAVVRFLLWERGRMVDEYLSVPSYYGELPKGDELALEANPTLVARLTGADRDEVRRVARTAVSPAELPPGPELYERLARVMGLEP